MNDEKPKRVQAKISRTVTEIAIVMLDRDGNIEEYEVQEELGSDDENLIDIRVVLSVHD